MSLLKLNKITTFRQRLLGSQQYVRLCTNQEKSKSDHVNSIEQAVQNKDYQLLRRLVREWDPYEVQRREINKKSSEHQPNLIPSDSDQRIIGCVCATEMPSINWIEVTKGKPTKCYCGYWFKLVPFQDYFSTVKPRPEVSETV